LRELFDYFSVSDARLFGPERIVACLYGSNRNYLEGSVRPDCVSAPFPLPVLYRFYQDDFNDIADGTEKPDKRMAMIECQIDHAVALNSELEWIAMPKEWKHIVDDVYELIKPNDPTWYPYSSHPRDPINEIAKDIESEFRRFMSTKMLVEE
jgi:hypothetical protein